MSDWWTQGAKRVRVGCEGERRSGWAARRFSAKIVPELWLAREMWGMFRWRRSAGTVSRNVEMRWFRGTGVEPPNPGLWGVLKSLELVEKNGDACVKGGYHVQDHTPGSR